MGLIINKKIKQLLKGYPTVSDKYNVAGGVNADTEAMDFGEVVKFGTATGQYVKFTAAPGANEVAGICMAKNVKLVTVYPADGKQAQIFKGEAIDLFVDGYIAVELDDAMVTKDASGNITAISAIAEGTPAYLTWDSTANAVKFAALETPGTAIQYGVFTGITEINYGKALAEIVVK